LKKIGTDWLSEMSSLVLIVPSAINSLDKNLLLNPEHPEMKNLNIEIGRPFQFDPRMFGK
jgi:RES domain-containing protein